MTDETRRRIKAYRRALPGMRQRIIAAALMLAVALATVGSATYAWITLSAAPEVTGLDTTVVANGSLEIALANGTGSAPGKSGVGDSTGAGTAVTAANITWGNLVNLSDPAYGLTNITLRPAALNGTTGLLTNPLFGVGYGEDGRVDTMVTDDDFAYVYFDTESGKFLVDTDGSHLGVRGISTVKYENLEGDQTLTELLKLVNQALSLAKNNYATMTDRSKEPGSSFMTSLEGLIQIYAQNAIDRNPESALDITEYVPALYEMMVYFNDNVVLPAGESYVNMANMLELMKGSGSGDAGYTVATLAAATRANTLPDYIKNNIPSLSTFANDYTQLQTYLKTSAAGDYSDLTTAQKNSSLAYWAYYAENGGTVYWSNLNGIINWICDINTAKLDGYTMSQLSNISTAMKILQGSNHQAIIYAGAIYRMEKRIGQQMNPTISVTVDPSNLGGLAGAMGNQTLEATLTTDAKDPWEIPTDRDAVKNLNTGSFRGDTATAEDTYAMAIDLWLRSNAGSSSTVSETVSGTDEDGNTVTTVTDPARAYLTLEGTVITELREFQDTMEDTNGEEWPAYTATFTLEGETTSLTVFERYGVYWYIDDTGTEVNLEQQVGGAQVTYTPKITTKKVVIGYDGANRVWNETQMAPYENGGTSTTQGLGSCYVFYADTPADQSRFLELLGAMKVVFIDASGRQIGFAIMDTENYYAQNGKVTVPLALDKSQAVKLGTNVNGKEIYGLTALIKNAATRITALVYLDGTRLTNEMVLASGDIQGNLNIQFSTATAVKTVTTVNDDPPTTSYTLQDNSESVEYEPVMDDSIEVSASVTQSAFTYDPANPATTRLNVKVEGVTPGTVTARFIRAISATQGTQQERITLTGSGSDWSVDVTFLRPGNYILRSMWVDGVEYDLETPVTVRVTGSSVNSVICAAIASGNRTTIMTADNSFSTTMTLGFTTSAQVPSRVNGIFMDETGRQVNVPFTLEAGTWKGTASFSSSGTYTMQYVEIDGDLYELGEALQKTLEIMLGLKVRTWITASPETMEALQAINPDAVPTRFVLGTGSVTLQVSAEIYDNTGKEIVGLSDVKVYYRRAGSNLDSTGLDSNLTWDSASGRYTGNFQVTRAGTFAFNRLAVTIDGSASAITSYTSAPSIQAMPPEDSSYYNNYTEEYQYAPNLNAAMTIGIAYSNAASKIEATITNGTVTQTVEGVMGMEAEDQGSKSVNLWSFAVPEINGLQEGRWTLTDITMYGVYYDGDYYDSEHGVTVNLENQNIHTKVVNYLYVTLSGTSKDFTGTFMADNQVNGMNLTIADYEGAELSGLTISDVKVNYYLNTSTYSNYGYTVADVSSLSTAAMVSGEGTKTTATEYSISTMNFRYAGEYTNCAVSFAINGVTASAGTNFILRYTDNGAGSDTAPHYSVTWTNPTAKFTAVSPTGSFVVNPGTGSTNTKMSNSFTDYTVTVYYKATYSSCLKMWTDYTPSKATITLSGCGSKFTSATLTIVSANEHYAEDDGHTENAIFTFTPSSLSNQQSIGSNADGTSSTRRVIGSNRKVTTIDITTSDGVVCTLPLSNELTATGTY